MANDVSGRVVLHVQESALLAGNPLGDPWVRTLPVYLPPSYDKDPGRRFPTLYLLPGFTGMGLSFLNVTAFSENLPRKLDRLIGSGTIGEMIVVMVDAFTRVGGSQYLDSPATGPYRSYLLTEVVPGIDRAFRTVPGSGSRALAGKSSGGFGTLSIALNQPGHFAAYACHSGDMYFPYCYLPDFPKALRALKTHGTPDRLLQTLDDPGPKDPGFFDLINVLAMAMAYSPEPSDRLFAARLPFDPETGEICEEVWERWLAFDPVREIETKSEALDGVKLLYLDCGDQDEYALNFGARIFCRKLLARKIPFLHEEFKGGHRDVTFRYDRSFALISRVFSAQSG